MDPFKVLSSCSFLILLVGLAVSAIKPTNLAREVVCEGCHAAITESNALLANGKRGAGQIRQTVQNMCQINKLTKYEFSPPNMVKACNYWKDNYSDEVAEVLSDGGDAESQEIQLCFVVTDVCQGVDRSRFRINKYLGPNKSKINAALAEEDEEVPSDEEGETVEDAFITDEEEAEEEKPDAAEKEREIDSDENENEDENEMKVRDKPEKKEKGDDKKDGGAAKKGKEGDKDGKKGKGDKKGKDSKKDKGKKDKDGKKGKDGKKDKSKKDKDGKKDKPGKKDKSNKDKNDEHSKKKGKKNKDEL